MRYSDDQSIFAWEHTTNYMSPGLLARSPDWFVVQSSESRRFMSPNSFARRQPHAITNEGISVELDLLPVAPRVYIAELNATFEHGSTASRPNPPWPQKANILLQRLDTRNRYARLDRRIIKDLPSIHHVDHAHGLGIPQPPPCLTRHSGSRCQKQ